MTEKRSAERDIDVLLDRYANALLLHQGDRHKVEECEHCRVCRRKIKTFITEARASAVADFLADKTFSIQFARSPLSNTEPEK